MDVNRALRHYLESLQLAGLEQLDKASESNVAAILEQWRSAEAGEHDTRHSEARDTVQAEHRPGHGDDMLAAAENGSKLEQLSTVCAEVAACQRCPALVASRTKTVFGIGNPDARICFFGEGPGADEDRQGEPFVGAAGQLLDKIITACKMKRSDVYILNTVKCRPPGNRNPEATELTNCRPFFERQLEIIRPEFIVCLGKVAANTLLENDSPVGRLRGKFHEWRFARVIATYHPAYLLRNPEAKKPVWEDMKMLMRETGVQL